MGYFVPTKNGQQGPFTVDQLQSFVDRGRLPIETAVVDEDSGLRMQVSLLVDAGNEPVGELPPLEPVRSGVVSDYDEPAAEPEPAAPPSRGRRRSGSGELRRSAAGRRRGVGGRRPQKRKSSAVVPLMIAVVLAIGAGTGAAFVFKPVFLFGAPFLGTWKIDTDSMVESMIAQQRRANPDAPELTEEMKVELSKVLVRELVKIEVEFTATRIYGRGSSTGAAGFDGETAYTWRALGGRYEITTEDGEISYLRMVDSDNAVFEEKASDMEMKLIRKE